MRFEWDPAKEAANRRKHGLSFGDVTGLFTGGADYLELPDAAHDDEEERIIAISARRATRTEIALYRKHLEGQPWLIGN